MSAGPDPDRDTLRAQDEVGLRAWHDRPVLFGIAALLVLFGLPCVIWLLGRHTGDPNDSTTGEPNHPVAAGDNKGADEQLRSGEPSEESKPTYVSDAHSYVKRLVGPDRPEEARFQKRVKEIQTAWDGLHEEATAWHDQRSRLLSGEEGKRLAARADLVDEFIKTEDWGRPWLDEAQRIKERLDGFANIVERAENPLVVEEESGEDVFEELTALNGDISTARQQLKTISQRVETLQEQAADLPPATVSLEEAMKKVREQATARQVEDILAKRQTGIDEKDGELVGLEIKEVGRRMGDKLRKAREETAQLEQEKRRLEEAANEAARKREEDRIRADLERRFEPEYGKMKGYLTAFTSPGYTQWLAGDFLPIAVKKPVSYQRLVNAGLLNAGEESLFAFWSAVDKVTNDRERGAFPAPSYSSGHRERHYETVLKIREFLIEFGPLMAKKGHLSP